MAITEEVREQAEPGAARTRRARPSMSTVTWSILGLPPQYRGFAFMRKYWPLTGPIVEPFPSLWRKSAMPFVAAQLHDELAGLGRVGVVGERGAGREDGEVGEQLPRLGLRAAAHEMAAK